jgi:hypothetical protein
VVYMNGLMMGISRFIVLLLVSCFTIITVMCFAELSFWGAIGSNWIIKGPWRRSVDVDGG